MSIPSSLVDAASAAIDAVGEAVQAVLSAEPAPNFAITVNSNDITTEVKRRLISLTITDAKGFEADTIELSLDDTDGRLEIPPKGATITCAIGWAGKPLADKGKYTVDDIEHRGAPDTLTIRARSADLRTSLNQRRDQSWHDTTIGKIAAEIATRNQLDAKVLPKLKDVKVPHIDQTAESDASFITRLASSNGGIATVKNGALLLLMPGESNTASGKPLPAVFISRRAGDQHAFSISDRENYNAVHAQWHDNHTGKHGTVIADAEGVRDLNGDPNQIKKDAAVAQEQAERSKKRAAAARAKAAKAANNLAAQERAERAEATAKRRQQRADELNKQSESATAPPANDPTLPDTGTAKMLRHIYASRYTAERAAKAAFTAIQRGIASFEIVLAHGREELLPELPAVVSGFKPQIDNAPWVLGTITHTIGDGGYTTRLTLEVSAEDLA